MTARARALALIAELRDDRRISSADVAMLIDARWSSIDSTESTAAATLVQGLCAGEGALTWKPTNTM